MLSYKVMKLVSLYIDKWYFTLQLCLHNFSSIGAKYYYASKIGKHLKFLVQNQVLACWECKLIHIIMTIHGNYKDFVPQNFVV